MGSAISGSGQSSGVLNSSRVICANPCRLLDVTAYTNGSVNAVVTIYDNATTNSGNILSQFTVLAANLQGSDYLPIPIRAGNGLYATISGTGASFKVIYDPQSS